MKLYYNQTYSQSREGVELWELGESLVNLSNVENPESTSSSCGSSNCPSSIKQGPSPRIWAPPWEGDSDPMSLRECSPHYVDSLQQGLTRSRSFGGLLVTPSLGRRSFGHGVSTLRSGWADLGVLGQAPINSPREMNRSGPLPPHVKLPKAPRPQRATIVSGAVIAGLRECSVSARKDILTLTSAQQDFKRAKQIKSAERYLKRVDYLLTQIEDLQDQYFLNQKLRDGARTMAYAYALSPGREKSSALSNVRSGYKECSDTLRSLEVEMERLMGTFTLEMKGIQGFARLCPGDVFEVSVKHGSQKWKIRGKIAKDNTQIWESPIRVFKALLGDLMVIKACEVRILGKSSVIGSKACETKNLFSAFPQLMTINLNSSGSLKLSIFITWNPLDLGGDDTLMRTTSLSGPSPRASRKSTLHSMSYHHTKSNYDGDQDSSFGSMSARSSTIGSSSPASEYRATTSSSQGFSNRTDNSSPVSDIHTMSLNRRRGSHDSSSYDGRDSASPQYDTGNFTLVRRGESRVAQWAKYSRYNTSLDGSSSPSVSTQMSRSFPNLNVASNALLDDSSQQSSTTGDSGSTLPPNAPSDLSNNSLSQSFSRQFGLLSLSNPDELKWMDGRAWDSSVPSTLPEVINRLRGCLEDIQGQFPELSSLEESVLNVYQMCNQVGCRTRRDSNTSEISLSVESALECFDFLNAECDDDFADDGPEEYLAKSKKESLVAIKRGCAPNRMLSSPFTGSSQLDAFLLLHLQHALRLLRYVGSFGPLRRREAQSLSKLKVEGDLLSTILSHRHNFDSLRPQHIMPVPHVQVLWDSVTVGEDWCVTGADVVRGLAPVVSSLLDPEHGKDFEVKVLEELVCRMTNNEIYSNCLTVTAGHFLEHLMRPLQETIPEIAADLHCSMLLSQRDPTVIKEGLCGMRSVSLCSTKLICQHFLGPTEFSSLIENFMEEHGEDEVTLSALYENCLQLLESTNSSDRSSACTFLGFMLPYLTSLRKNELVAFSRESTKNDAKGAMNFETKSTISLPESSLELKSCLRNGDETAVTSLENLEEEISQLRTEDLTGAVGSIGDPNVKSRNLNQSSSVHDPSLSRTSMGGESWRSFSHHPDQPIIALSFLRQNDPSQEVRNSAKLALLNLGSRGYDALQQVQLSSHGFQGLDVRDDAAKSSPPVT